jgi:uncharacterized membrane protein
MRKAAKFFAGPGMLLAGINHFVNPKVYRPLMPDYLPAHHELILASGAFEIAAGVGSMIPATRKYGRWISIATLVGVFPAHIHMLQHADDRFKKIPRWALIARMPLQLVMIAAVWDATKDPEPKVDYTTKVTV